MTAANQTEAPTNRSAIAVADVSSNPANVPAEESILAHCREHLAAYKRRRAVAFDDHLTTTSSGKLIRRKLSELDSR